MSPRLLPLLLAATAIAAQAAEPLGRLFYTPEQRAALDRQRLSAPLAAGGGAPATLNGVVRRSSGRNTVWINGVAADEPQGSIPRQQVGETLAPGGSEASDLLRGGRIVVHPKPAGR